LNDNNINFGLFFFLARRVDEMKLAYISMRQDYLVQFTPTSETSSLAADMMRVGEANKLLDRPKAEDSSEPWAMMTPVNQNFDHLNTSNHGSLVNVKAKKNFPTKALKSRLDKTKFTTKLKLVSPALSLEIWAREFLELFRLKVLMVQKETKNREDEMLKQGLAETNNFILSIRSALRPGRSCLLSSTERTAYLLMWAASFTRSKCGLTSRERTSRPMLMR
jgi:hypothetical protein